MEERLGKSKRLGIAGLDAQFSRLTLTGKKVSSKAPPVHSATVNMTQADKMKSVYGDKDQGSYLLDAKQKARRYNSLKNTPARR